MFGLLDRLARRLLRQGVRKALLEGSRAWLVLAAFAGLVHLLTRREPPRVERVDLGIGESLLVRHLASERRRGEEADAGT